uniref:Uncharacterized protein n=1 Tax=Candidatus Kentrum sp. LPFa TaxID=2126335 RepID=A0A450X1T4_9GAMM|nr:MAG: hypothetical protein BECKLPF1236B_GA0070989_13461 [Candidatus Kentron sp. LPFa]
MNRRQALFQYHFTLESRAPYSIIWYWKRLFLYILAFFGHHFFITPEDENLRKSHFLPPQENLWVDI